MSLSITGGNCLLPEGFAPADLRIADGAIAPPGIVDLHGDATAGQVRSHAGSATPAPP